MICSTMFSKGLNTEKHTQVKASNPDFQFQGAEEESEDKGRISAENLKMMSSKELLDYVWARWGDRKGPMKDVEHWLMLGGKETHTTEVPFAHIL